MKVLEILKNPVNWIIGLLLRRTIKRLFFNNITSKSFNLLIENCLEYLPNETFINIVNLLINTFRSKPSDLTKLNTIKHIMTQSVKMEERLDISVREDLRVKYLILFLMMGIILKKLMFIFKNIILLPFKLGVYSFICFLFGIKVDYILSFFDIFKFNLPSWTYNKLLELHLNWLGWFRSTFKISSIRTDLEIAPQLPKPGKIVENEIKPDTYLYLTKEQWLYLSISAMIALGVYLGFTGGIPFSRSFEWTSDSNGNDSGDEEVSTHTIQTRTRGDGKTWQDTLTDWATKLTDTIKKPFKWFSGASDSEYVTEAQIARDRELNERLKREDEARLRRFEELKGEWVETIEEKKQLKLDQVRIKFLQKASVPDNLAGERSPLFSNIT